MPKPKPTEPKLYIDTIDNYRPQSRNANRHNERGLGMLNQAMSEDGYVAPMTAAADGEVIDGSARLETAAERFGDEVIVLEHDGRRPIVTKRVDIPSADTEEAKRISLRANRVAEVDLSWDVEVLKELDQEDLLKGLFTAEELEKLFSGIETIPEPEQAVGNSKEVTCPNCGERFNP